MDGEVRFVRYGTEIPIKKFSKTNVKQNGGNLYINQISTIKRANAYQIHFTVWKGSMRNLSYHNYAFNSDDVYALMSQESVMLGKPYVQSRIAVTTTICKGRYRFNNNIF
jgi:hypothetical protein